MTFWRRTNSGRCRVDGPRLRLDPDAPRRGPGRSRSGQPSPPADPLVGDSPSVTKLLCFRSGPGFVPGRSSFYPRRLPAPRSTPGSPGAASTTFSATALPAASPRADVIYQMTSVPALRPADGSVGSIDTRRRSRGVSFDRHWRHRTSRLGLLRLLSFNRRHPHQRPDCRRAKSRLRSRACSQTSNSRARSASG